MVLTIASVALPSLAAPSPADIATAKPLVVEGRELRAKGDHVGARDRFKAAWALVTTPIVGLDLAREHLALGELIEAREIAVEVTKLPANPKESDEGRAARVEARKLADDLLARIPSVVVTIEGVPSGASPVVTIDGEVIPPAALGAPRKVNPGKRIIVAQIPGFTEIRETITIAERATRDVKLRFAAKASSAPLAGAAPAPTPDHPPSSGSTSAGTWTIAGFTVAGLGVIVGGVGAIVWASKEQKLASTCRSDGTCDYQGFESDQSVRDASRIVALSGFGLALVGVAVGVVSLTAHDKVASSAHRSPVFAASISIGPGRIGLAGVW